MKPGDNDPPRPRILIVDDEPANIDMLARRLSVRRFSVSTAVSGEAALKAIKLAPPDLVLLDHMMPGMTGLEVLYAIRKVHGAATLPVIMLTASNSRETMLAAIGGGANDYVTKPVDFELLLARMAVQLHVRDEFRRAVAEQARLRRRLETRARLEELGYGDPERRIYIMNELHRGVREGEVRLFYQPQYRLRPGAIEAAEALMRWSSPVLGDMPAQQFIQLAEETGDIAELTEWVVKRAIADHAQFAKAGHKVRVAVNLSATLAADTGFADQLLAELSSHPGAVSLELTESAIFDNPDAALANLRRFADAGVRIAIDDYGTGMSSLSYIQQLPVQELKIDRMFISKLTSSHRDPLLVRSTIELAHALEFEVVAEGVEDAETLALLAVMGCDIVQGYFVGAPMSADDFMTYLEDNTRRERLGAPLDAKALLRGVLGA